MFKRYITWFFIMLLIPLSTAFAGESKTDKTDWYFGANMYRLNINLGQNDFEKEIMPTQYNGVGFTAGVVPFRNVFDVANIGFEFGYLQNGHENSVEACISSYCANAQSDLNFKILTLNTIISFPFPGNEFSAFGGVGVGYIEYNVNASINYKTHRKSGKIASASRSGNGIAPSINFGIEYRPTNSNLSAKLKYTNFTALINSDNNADMISLGINYHF